MNPKIKKQQELKKIIDEFRSKGKTVGFTNGCFDIIHVGHVQYLADAKNNCDILILALNSDRSVSSIKGPERPINKEGSRAEVVAALESIDFVTIFDQDTPYEVIKLLVPDILFKGGDWLPQDVVGNDIVRSNNGKVMIIPFRPGFSTTNILKKIQKEG
ncbi:MAG: D-glycero-beta-D-manno-heptose 1-phosphate adenylyltransferase [Candidatus Omnitrophica bacterium]|nr:D-glycero-beta-D-manno-heptose 1-phosphate adenylyltransferase [Candidatus Omnitrophota bacterium]